jgi:aspartyl-tRNA(Asn)/glutamyl-tRNA(Gln) amidotransferase subunit A
MNSDRELTELTAVELIEAYSRRVLSPVEVHAAVQRRIDSVESTIGALYAPDPQAAAEAARASEARWRAGEPIGAIDGIPVTVKENIATRGVPLPAGTAASDLVPAEEDGPAAARIREAGGVILGKTTMPDIGMLSSGLSSFHQLTRNPWNPAWNPGGSSAGAAAACAAGYGPLHVGSDIGGSLRLPASWTATVSLKPSFGRVPVDPPYYGRVVGPITRTAADAALFMGILAQPDDRDYMSLPPAAIDWSALDGDVAGLRVALLLDAGCGLPVQEPVRAAVEAAAKEFEQAGAVVEPIGPFFTADQLHDLDLFWRVRGWEWFSQLSHEKQSRVLPYIADWCRSGADTPGVVLMRCVNRMLEIAKCTVQATKDFDLVLSPVAPVVTYPAEWPSPTNDVERALEHIAFTAPYNFSGQPAASVNCGWTADGKPIGLQIAGRRFDDLGVLRATHWYEQVRGPDVSPAWPPAAMRTYAVHTGG